MSKLIRNSEQLDYIFCAARRGDVWCIVARNDEGQRLIEGGFPAKSGKIPMINAFRSCSERTGIPISPDVVEEMKEFKALGLGL